MKPTRNAHPTPKPVASNRNVRWYRHTRAWLLHELGGKCADCGTTLELEFDELVPRPPGMPAPNRTSRWQRLRNYIKAWRRGQLAARCRACNASKGEPAPLLPHGAGESEPF